MTETTFPGVLECFSSAQGHHDHQGAIKMFWSSLRSLWLRPAQQLKRARTSLRGGVAVGVLDDQVTQVRLLVFCHHKLDPVIHWQSQQTFHNLDRDRSLLVKVKESDTFIGAKSLFGVCFSFNLKISLCLMIKELCLTHFNSNHYVVYILESLYDTIVLKLSESTIHSNCLLMQKEFTGRHDAHAPVF